jgi:MGT family glycosyltransferase
MTPAYGHVLPVLPIIRELIYKGNEVTCYNTPAFRERIENLGAHYREYGEEFQKLKLDEVTSNLYVLMDTLITFNEQLYDIYLEEISGEKPDLLMYDSMLSFAKNIAYKLKLKSVCMVATIGFNLPVCMFSNISTSSVPLVMKNAGNMRRLIKQDKAYRKERGLKGFKLIDLFMNTADLTLVMTPEKLQPLAWTFPKSVHFVGTTIKEQIEMYHGAEYDDYDCYISMGTVFSNNVNGMREFLELPEMREKKIMISASETPDWMKAMTNVRAEKWVYNVDLIPKCKLFINVGGAGSVYTAMYYGVKQISIPAQEEERYNAKIMKRHKAGIYLKKYDTQKLAGALQKLDGLKPDICRQIVRSADGTATSVKLIEELTSEK